jgi:sigma-E factor negative regulatory protein RseC
MIEIAKVTEANEKRVTVRVDKKDECSKCGMCLFPKGADGAYFHAENTLGAKEGDIVQIELGSNGNLIGAILVFLVPLILIGLSALITYLIIKNEIYMLVLGVGSVVVWFVILALIDKKIGKSKTFSPKLIKIIEKNTI